MKLKVINNNRGFICIEFKDLFGSECSIQESSLADKEAIWFGVDDHRMHLEKKQVEALLPILKRFVETGAIIERQ